MSSNKSAPTEKSTWPPEALKAYDKKKLESSPYKLNEIERNALTRFCSKDNENLRHAFDSLCKNSDEEKVSDYLEDVFERYLDGDFYEPTKDVSVKAWYRRIAHAAKELAETLEDVPSGDLRLQPWLRNMEDLISQSLEPGDEESELAGGYRQVRRHPNQRLNRLPPSTVIRKLEELATQGVEAPPKYYWEQDLGITAPRKHGDHGELAREQILLRSLKTLTRRVFSKPHHEVVATLLNVLLDTEKFTTEAVQKAPEVK